MSKFKVGDLVVKHSGKKPLKLINQYNTNYYYARYCHNNSGVYVYDNEIKLYEEGEITMNTKTLYSFKLEDGTIAYGTHIGTNAENKYVLEVKGSGAILVKDKKEIEEVLPYTYSIADSKGQEIHVVGEPDTLKAGDVIMFTENKTYTISQVLAVNTKSKTARAKLKNAVKLVTEPI